MRYPFQVGLWGRRVQRPAGTSTLASCLVKTHVLVLMRLMFEPFEPGIITAFFSLLGISPIDIPAHLQHSGDTICIFISGHWLHKFHTIEWSVTVGKNKEVICKLIMISRQSVTWSEQGEKRVWSAPLFMAERGESKNPYFYLPEVALKGYTRN